MCCRCPCDFYSAPFDYQISPEAHGSLFQNRDPRDFAINVNDHGIFQFTLCTNRSNRIDFKVKEINSENHDNAVPNSLSGISDLNEDDTNEDQATFEISSEEKCELLRRLFLGEKICIDIHNFSFIHSVADSIGIPELYEIKNISGNHGFQQVNQVVFPKKRRLFYLPKSAKSILFHIWTHIFNCVCKFGVSGRLLVSFWDIAGPTMVICLFLNILILFVTMSLSTLKDYLVAFFLVVIPFLLYSLYFPNIISIAVCEALACNLFLKPTFFYSQQRLISMFFRVLFGFDYFPKYLNMGKLHNFFHGVLFLIIVFAFLANMMNEYASRFIDIWVQLFVFYIPVIRYFSLYIFYLVHSIISLFDKPRARFRELEDFEDPYLCSFYLTPRPWINFFKLKGTANKFSHNGSFFIQMLFSKTTFSILATIAVIIYMCASETKMSPGQVCITIFIGVCVIFVLSTRITFPFFWIRRIKYPKMTEAKLEEKFERIPMIVEQRLQKRVGVITESDKRKVENENAKEHSQDIHRINDSDSGQNEDIESGYDDEDEQLKEEIYEQEYLRWHQDAVTWSKKYVHLRWSSLVLILLTIVFIVILVIMDAVTAVETSKKDDGSTPPNKLLNFYRNIVTTVDSSLLDDPILPKELSNDDSTTSSRYPMAPICTQEIKGLSMMQILALTSMANPIPGQDPTIKYNATINEFFKNKGKVGEDIIFVETPFGSEKGFLSQMTLTRFRTEPKVSVFTIRGTNNDQDVIADAEIWFASVVMNIAINFLPFVSIYSDKTLELMGVVTNLPRYAFKQFSLVEEYKNRFVDYIFEYLYGNLSNDDKNVLYNAISRKNSKALDIHIDPDEDVLITGHSLGGGLAKILSLQTGIQSVAVSGPGVRFIGQFYKNETVKNIKLTILDVIPGEDLIARVDQSIGSQMNIPCKRGLACHNQRRAMCQMAAMCNTMVEHYSWCSHYFDNETIDEMMKQGRQVAVP